MRSLLASVGLALVTTTALSSSDTAAAKPATPKRTAWKPGIPSEWLPLRIDRTAVLLTCKRNKDCTITGRFGTNSRMRFALDGDDGKRRFALITAQGWDPRTLTFKVPPSVPANTTHRLTIIDEKDRRVSNTVQVLVSVPATCASPDMDGDGHDRQDCAGDDCDDNDANRYPGNSEVCEADNHDEDCDDTTFGFRDQDNDGHPDARCCNLRQGGLLCGDDCDDARSEVHPWQPEICNHVDDNCDGSVDDNGVQVKLFRDADADLFGNPSESKLVCIQDIDIEVGWVLDRRDCKDTDASVNPRHGCG